MCLMQPLAAGVKKFIHISTIIVVGPQKPGTIITEQTPHGPYPSDNYAKTKSEGECLAHSYLESGLPVITLRLGALYGPHGHYAFNRLFFEEFLYNWRVEVHKGRHIIFPCYVEDAAKGIEAALNRGRIGEVYNISDESISHREANKIISQLAGRSNWRINFPRWLMLQFVKILELIAFFTKREPFYPKNLEPYVFYDWIVDSSKAQRRTRIYTFLLHRRRSVHIWNGTGQSVIKCSRGEALSINRSLSASGLTTKARIASSYP